jgi:hypothetical protein
MDETLLKAINNLLNRITAHIVSDLLLIEVDWGDHTPAMTHQVTQVTFQGASWPLVYTDSELVLRRTLCQGRAILVFSRQSGFKIPRDVRARADQITPHQLGLRDRLYALTGRDWPAEVDYADWRPSVERRLDHLVRQATGTGLQWHITRNTLETMLIEAAFGLKVEGRNAAQLLADLTMTQRRQQGGATDPSASLTSGLERALLQGQLRARQLAWADVILWAAEGSGRAEELIRTGLMMAAEQTAGYFPNWGPLNALRAKLINERQTPEKEAIAGVIELATEALPHLHNSTRQAIVRAAERTVLPVLGDTYNPWFPEVLKREIEQVAGRLALRDQKAVVRVGQLAGHFFAAQEERRLNVLTAMANLITQWQAAEPEVEPLAEVAAWSIWYAEHGARIDLAALRLAEQQGTGLDQPVGQLLSQYWAWRDDLNSRFAGQFLANYEAALHDRAAGVFGVHRILSWGVRPWVAGDRRVLLLVVDGMGCAAFQHLLQAWAQETPAVYAQTEGEIRAALSLLPSVTSVARKGLFLAGLPTDRLDDEQAYAEKAKTTEAQALAQVFPQHTTRLYNKSNLAGGQALLNDLQFQMPDVIVAIFNAIDDDLKSTTPSVRLPDLSKDMGPLVNIVRTALESGWVVIITADHGHTWHRGKEFRLGPIVTGGGERFKPLAKGDTPPAGAAVTGDPNIVRVQTGAQVALLTTVGAYFGQHPRRGHHGGAGLEEVVVPYAQLTLAEPIARAEATAEITTEAIRTQTTYDLSGVVLNLADGRVISLDLPFNLSPTEVKLLQALARLGEASEADLKQAVSTRRIAGPLASLQERLATAGPNYEYVEQKGAGSGGAIYRFRVELLK